MKRNFLLSALGLGLFTLAGAAAARPAVVITGEPAGDQMVIAFDFVADNQPVTAVMVEIKLKEGTQKSQLGLSKCLANLSKTHTGGCNLKSNGNLAFLIYGASDNVALKSGQIGSVTVPKALLEVSEGGLVVPFVEFTLPNAQTVPGDAITEIEGIKPGTHAK